MTIETLSSALDRHYGQFRNMLSEMDAAVKARDWSTCANRASALNELLRRQIRFEEAEVFPAVFSEGPVVGGGATAIAEQLQTEHDSVRNMATLLGMSSPAHDPHGWQAVLVELGELLGRHMEGETAALMARSDGVSGVLLERLRRRLEELSPAAAMPRGEHFVDVSALEPPGPFVRIMDELSRGHVPLRVRIHREPLPLYGVLRDGGYAHRTTVLDDGCFEILIWHEPESHDDESGKA